jgi:hypothetical protein
MKDKLTKKAEGVRENKLYGILKTMFLQECEFKYDKCEEAQHTMAAVTLIQK